MTSTCQGEIPESQPCSVYLCEIYKSGDKLTSGFNVTPSLAWLRSCVLPTRERRRMQEQHFLSPLDGAATALHRRHMQRLNPSPPRPERRLKYLARKTTLSKISGRLSSTSRIGYYKGGGKKQQVMTSRRVDKKKTGEQHQTYLF